MLGHRLRFGGTLLVGGILISSCASIVEGTDQSIKVSLSPDQATCVVIREGAQIASLSRHNQFINISKSKNSLEIECKAQGHITENLTVESSASGWGVVGCIFIDLCITDYSTGALNKYPERITIALVPQNFKSTQSRDDWFKSRRRTLESRWDRRIEKKGTDCESAAGNGDCADEISKLKKQKIAQLKRLERQRLATTITPALPTSSSAESRLKTIQDLFDRGRISKEEYDRHRQEILSDI